MFSFPFYFILFPVIFSYFFRQVGEMLVPVTAHAAFDKAAELLGMRIRLEHWVSMASNIQARACGRGDEEGEGGDNEQDGQLAHRHARRLGSPVPPWIH